MPMDTDVWIEIKELLWAIVILSPPFPRLAAHIFLPLKTLAALIGVLVAVLSYGRVKKEQKKGVRARPIALSNVIVCAVIFVGYLTIFYRIDSPGQLIKTMEYVLYFYINVTIGYMLCIILFLAPSKRLRGWFSGLAA
jgi:hypothetical protein